jgi:hypothetical protein
VGASYLEPPSVSVLLAARGPADIAWFVISVVVDTVDLILARWSRTDAAKKRGEVGLPLLADADTAPSVVPISLDERISATVFQAHPGSILRRLVLAVAVFVLGIALPAPATPCAASSQFLAPDFFVLSAVARAHPSRLFIPCWEVGDSVQNNKASEALSGLIGDSVRHP